MAITNDLPPRRSARLGSSPLPPPIPSPPVRKLKRAHDHPSSAPEPHQPAEPHPPCTPSTTPRALRAAKRRRLSGPAATPSPPPPQPTTHTLQLQLPLGSIAMPGSPAHRMRKQPLLLCRSPLSSPPPSPGSNRKENTLAVANATLRRSPRKPASAAPVPSTNAKALPPRTRRPRTASTSHILPQPQTRRKRSPPKRVQKAKVAVPSSSAQTPSTLHSDTTPPIPSDTPAPRRSTRRPQTTPTTAPILPAKRKRGQTFSVHVDVDVQPLPKYGEAVNVDLQEAAVAEETMEKMEVDMIPYQIPVTTAVEEPPREEDEEIVVDVKPPSTTPAVELPLYLPIVMEEDAAIPKPPPSSDAIPSSLSSPFPPPSPHEVPPQLHISIPSHEEPQSELLPQDYAYSYDQPQYPPVEVQRQQQEQRQQVQVQQSRHNRDSFMLWKTACRLRVEYLQRRYTPLTIRDLVAQEADDYFLKHGYPKPDEEDYELDEDQEEDGCDGKGIYVFDANLDVVSPGEDRPPKRPRLSSSSVSLTQTPSPSLHPESQPHVPSQEDEEDSEDPDAEGDVDPEAYAHDPSFNAELSSALAQVQGGRGRARVSEAPGGSMGAFYVPMLERERERAPHLDLGEDIDMEQGRQAMPSTTPATPTSSPTSPNLPPESHTPPPPPLTPARRPSPFFYQTHESTTLPVPPPRLSTIPVLPLRQAETGTIGLIGRGTPVDRGRKAQWGWGVRPPARGRSGSGEGGRSGDRQRAVGIRRYGRTGRREMIGDVGAPLSPGMSHPTLEPDQVVWDAFFESLKRDGDPSSSSLSPPPPSPPSHVHGHIQTPPPPPIMDIPSQSLTQPHEFLEMMGMGVGVNMNMNINMSMNMGMGLGMGGLFSPSPTSPSPTSSPPLPSHSPPSHTGSSSASNPNSTPTSPTTDQIPTPPSPTDFEMFNVGFGVGVGVGIGMAVGSGWMAPPPSPTSPPPSDIGMGFGMGGFGMGMGMGGAPTTPEGFEQPTSSTADSYAIRDAIAAAQAKATTVPLRDSVGDDATVHATEDRPAAEIPSFKGFTDFELDLTCLSPPPSPPASIYSDARSNSPPASPRHSISFSFRSSSPSRGSRLSQAKSSSNLLPVSGAASVARGSWPLMRYVGRGTPVDKNRRIEWGATSNEGGGDDVGEDGFLFSTVRATSLDSAGHPSHRSVSAEWNNILDRRPSTIPSRRKSRSRAVDQPTPSPAIQIEGLGSEAPGEWASFMQTVLGESSSSATASTSQAIAPTPEKHPNLDPTEPIAAPATTLSPEEIDQLDTGLEIDLDIDGALDLGLGYNHRGMNWFDLGMLPASGRESPSVYSSHAPSPRASRPPTVTATPQKNRSAASIKVDTENSLSLQMKSPSPVWWRRVLHRLKKVHLLIGSH
ncbi:hypothetical protein H0H87_001962 [Tephrocybe sp. NHM501043]|nr:hypothetical protein H0H87_001962 [Tephrocybe sp. NHM501043]